MFEILRIVELGMLVRLLVRSIGEKTAQPSVQALVEIEELRVSTIPDLQRPVPRTYTGHCRSGNVKSR